LERVVKRELGKEGWRVEGLIKGGVGRGGREGGRISWREGRVDKEGGLAKGLVKTEEW
jgi:hypothetical protein